MDTKVKYLTKQQIEGYLLCLHVLERQTKTIAKEIQNLERDITETVERDDRIKEHLEEFEKFYENEKCEVVEIENDNMDNLDYDNNKQALKRFGKLFCQDSTDSKN